MGGRAPNPVVSATAATAAASRTSGSRWRGPASRAGVIESHHGYANAAMAPRVVTAPDNRSWQRAAGLIALFAVLTFAIRARAEVTVAPSREVVVDRAGIIDGAAKRQLTALLMELREKTGAEIKVVTVPSTDGEDFVSWCQRHYDSWKLGKKGKDNGALIALSVQDRKVRIHTGYGLEDVLPDSWCGTQSRAVAQQYFKRGAYSQGLTALTFAVAGKVATAAHATLSNLRGASAYPVLQPTRTRRGRGKQGPAAACGGCLIPALFLFFLLSSMSRRSRYHRRWGGGLLEGMLVGSIFSSMFGGRGGWGGGGGFGGGGFGGGGFGGGFGGGGGFSGGGGGGASW